MKFVKLFVAFFVLSDLTSANTFKFVMIIIHMLQCGAFMCQIASVACSMLKPIVNSTRFLFPAKNQPGTRDELYLAADAECVHKWIK